MTKPPLTRPEATAERSNAIRAAVRAVGFPVGGRRKIAEAADAAAFFRLIADPFVSDPIYTLPKPVTLDSTSAFIVGHIEEQSRGEGLLILDLDGTGEVAGYHDIQFWPQWSACELGGAIRRDRQGGGEGGAGAAMAFDWLFDTVGVDLICETAALDNIRTQKLLYRLGFRFICEIESELPGGGSRPSLYYEMTRQEWVQRDRSRIG